MTQPRRIPNAEATEHPWWAILDTTDPIRKGAIHQLANAVTGPFFSRESAQQALDNARHRYGDKAEVYCFSGYRSPDWRALCEEPPPHGKPVPDPLQSLRATRDAAVGVVRAWVDEQTANMRLVRNDDAPGWNAYVEAETALSAAARGGT